MLLVVVIDVLVVGILSFLALTRDLERALPFATFVLILVPGEAAFPIPGLFDLTMQRLVLGVLLVLYVVLPRETAGAEGLKTPLKWLMFAHITLCLVSTANSVVPVMSLKKMLSEVVEYYFLYLIYFKTIRSTQTIHRLMFSIVSAVVVASIFGTIEAYRGWSVLSWFPAQTYRFGWLTSGEEGRGLRVQSTFPHPILWGAALTLGIILALYLLTVSTNGRRRIFLWAGLLFMFLNIYKSESRGPWLALAGSLGLLLLFGQSQVRRYLTAVALLTAAVLVARPGVWHTIANIYDGTIDPNNNSGLNTSYEYRYQLKDVAVQALSQSLTRQLWGYGMESFYYLHLSGTLDGKPYPFTSCDSSWIEFMVETGYLGLLIMVLLLMAPLWIAWRDLRELPKPDSYFTLYSMVILSAYYFMMLSVAMYAWGQNGYMLWIIIASTFAFRRLTRVAHQVTEVEPLGSLQEAGRLVPEQQPL